jgi:hypothetical protein
MKLSVAGLSEAAFLDILDRMVEEKKKMNTMKAASMMV